MKIVGTNEWLIRTSYAVLQTFLFNAYKHPTCTMAEIRRIQSRRNKKVMPAGIPDYPAVSAIYFFIQLPPTASRLLAARNTHEPNGVVLKGDIPIRHQHNSIRTCTEPFCFNLKRTSRYATDNFSGEQSEAGAFPTFNWDSDGKSTFIPRGQSIFRQDVGILRCLPHRPHPPASWGDIQIPLGLHATAVGPVCPARSHAKGVKRLRNGIPRRFLHKKPYIHEYFLGRNVRPAY